jgi:membrane protein required for colicin V production
MHQGVIMDINYFDLAVAAIILLLGLKGIVNGFFKELFGLVGIIGGIFIASRFGDQIGHMLSDKLFHFESKSAAAFTGFLLVLALFWLVMVILGMVFKKLSKESGLGPVDRFFGFIFSSGKFFLIASIIAYAVFNIKSIRSNLKNSLSNSIAFPIMVETGQYIMQIDPEALGEDIGSGVDSAKESLSDSMDKAGEAVHDIAVEHSKEIIEDVKEHAVGKSE